MTGLAIGATVANPFIGVPAAILMHFAGDLVPHWDFYSNTSNEERRVGWRPLAVMADLILGVALGLTCTLFALWVKNDPSLAMNIFLCGIGSVIPDALEGPHIYLHKEPKILKLISSTQSKLQFQAPLPWGIISQLLIMFFSLLVISNSLI
jgi:hypothetical protein